MLPCSKNSIPYPGKSFSFKLTKKPREIGLNCSLRNKNQKCHGQNVLQVRKVLRKCLHVLSRRKSYRGGEKTWTRGKLLIAWLRFYLLIPHRLPPPHLFFPKKYFIFSYLSCFGEREAKGGRNIQFLLTAR